MWSGGPVEFDRLVPASGNLFVAGRQFWLGPLRAGKTVRFWADTEMLHLAIDGARVKTLRSLGRVHAHQTVTIAVSECTLAIELDDGETRVVRRTTT